MAKYRKVLEEAVNVTSTNRGFRTIQHSVATYEQTKKGLSYFIQKNSRRRWNTHKTLKVALGSSRLAMTYLNTWGSLLPLRSSAHSLTTRIGSTSGSCNKWWYCLLLESMLNL